MKKKRLSKSTRKFIRLEKARIRREALDLKEQERLIQELYKKMKHDTNIRIDTNDTNQNYS